MKREKSWKERGQALVEFALILPVLMFFVAGIFDFSRILFAYAQASQQLRTAVREAPVIGFEGGGLKPYLRCADMIDIAENVFFAENPTATVAYFDAETGPGALIYNNCNQANGDAVLQVEEDDLTNGDYLVITSTGTVRPVFNAWIPWDFEYTFVGQRTIVTGIQIGSGDPQDTDYDGLRDDWEEFCYGDIDLYNATDDWNGVPPNNGLAEQSAMERVPPPPPFLASDC